MRLIKSLLTNLLLVLLIGSLSQADDNLADPYEILAKQYEAMGGLERLKAEKTSYSESTIKISGMEGTVKSWSESPLKSRQELDLGILKQTSGDNGDVNWTVDVNGKLQYNKDEETLKRRKIAKLLKEYDHLNRDSENFVVTFEGIEKVGEVDCYIVRITNNINNDTSLSYINTSTSLEEKSVGKQPDGESHSVMSDYRDIDGLMVPFKVDIEQLPVGQKILVQVTEYKSNPEIDPALFEPPEEDVEDFEFTHGNSAENVPFKFIENHIYITVNIGGKERDWILDTGAGMSVIDSVYAIEAGLKLEGEMKGSGAGNTVNFTFTNIPEYSIPGLKMHSQTAAVLNVVNILKKFGTEASGILGYDFLSRFITRIDYANETISFYHPEHFQYKGDGTIIDAPLKGNCFTVPVTVDGKFTGRWNFDTGASSCGFHYPFAEANNMQALKGIEKMGFGAGGSFMERNVEFNTIEFAGHTLTEPLLDVPLEKGAGAFSGGELIGNLGSTLMRHFVIYLNYKDQQLIVEKGDDFDKVFPRDKSGLQLIISDDDRFEVIFVAPGTPADKAGFETGDIVKSINGIDAEYLDGLIAVRKMLKGNAGTEFVFAIERDGAQKDIKLKLRDLF